jgi:hypothetical protein
MKNSLQNTKKIKLMDRPFAVKTPFKLKPDERLYFLHIEKTAGRSFSQLIESFYTPQDTLIVHPKRIEGIGQAELLQYHLYTGHYGYRFLDLFPETKPIWVTMLRDPVDRVISNYYFWRQQAKLAIENEVELTRDIALTLEYDLYTYLIRPITTPPVHNRQARYLFDDATTISEKFDQTLSDNILETIKQRLTEECTFLGITERYNESARLLYYTFGWRPYRMVHKKEINVTKDRPKINEIEPKIIDLIVEQNQLDIEIYQFAKDLFSTRYDTMIQRMLQQNYEHFFAQYFHPQSEISLRHDNPIFDTKEYAQGWYNNDGEIRWTGPESSSLVDVYLKSGLSYEIVIEIERGVTQEILNSFQLTINQHPISLSKQVLDNSVQFIGNIPSQILDKPEARTEVVLSVDHTSRPLDNIDDTRQLGIALIHIDIYPQSP